MLAIVILGFFALIFAILYLIYHFIRKIKNKERTLSKKTFYPLFVGGLILMIVGGAFIDTGAQAKLDTALKQNAKLTADNKTLKSENAKLEKQITNLEFEIKETSSKITEYENNIKSFEDEKTAFTSEKKSLNKKISKLTTTNTELQNEIDSLKSQLASAESASSSASNSVSTDNSTASASSGEREIFENCTDLRGTYPNGVPSSHPAYVPSMDRDKDNYACER